MIKIAKVNIAIRKEQNCATSLHAVIIITALIFQLSSKVINGNISHQLLVNGIVMHDGKMRKCIGW